MTELDLMVWFGGGFIALCILTLCVRNNHDVTIGGLLAMALFSFGLGPIALAVSVVIAIVFALTWLFDRGSGVLGTVIFERKGKDSW